MLKDEFKDVIGFAVSHTTRAPRDGEEHMVHYNFCARDAFFGAEKFVEFAEVHENLYGTSQTAIENVREKGQICILDIDVQGVQAVLKSGLAPNTVYIAPPSMGVLEERLRGRATESEENIVLRMANAQKDMCWLEGNVDVKITNGDLMVAYTELREQILIWYPELSLH